MEETGRQIRELEPPVELRLDHDVVLQYFEETLEVARAITRAAEAQDRAKLETELFPRSGEVLCRARVSLSPEVIPIVSIFFGPQIPEFCR